MTLSFNKSFVGNGFHAIAEIKKHQVSILPRPASVVVPSRMGILAPELVSLALGDFFVFCGC
jgi:hypothetical protein